MSRIFRNVFQRWILHILTLYSHYQSVKLANLLKTSVVTFSTGDTDLGHYLVHCTVFIFIKMVILNNGCDGLPFIFHGEEEEH